jgi:phage terminase large subunit
MNINKIYLPDVVGKGYKKFWEFKGRYRVCKGSRASKKSKTMALWTIVNIMKYPQANMLVIRQTASTLKGSCFTELKWAIHRLGVEDYWKYNENPLEMTYLPTGQKIYFRGLDDPLKVTSITVEVGVLCWMWIEEAYELNDEHAFDTLDESIRGAVPEGLFKQITLTFNPWNEHHWLKARFFDVVDEDILAMTTNYMCNEWLDEHDLKLFEDMKKNRPKRYEVAGLGNWGITDGIIFENWEVQDLTDMIPTFANIYHGLDFGATDPNALVCIDVEIGQKKIYVFDEYYEGNITLDKLASEVGQRIDNRFVTCDSAGKQHIIELNNRGIWALPAIKGPDSITHGIQWLQGFDIIVHKDCRNFVKEISNYCWAKDKFGKSIDVPVDANNHLLDALRYGVEPLHSQAQLESAKRIT